MTRELTKVQATKVAKDQAIKSFDQTYRQVVGILVDSFRLAGMTELADRIPTSLRDRSRSRKKSKESQPEHQATATLAISGA